MPEQTAWGQHDAGSRKRRLRVWGLLAVGTVLVLVLDLAPRRGAPVPDLLIAAVPYLLIWAIFGSWVFLRRRGQDNADIVSAVPLPREPYPEVVQAVDAMVTRKGLVEPDLWLIDTPSLNALLGDGSLIYTRGLLDSLTSGEILAITAWLCALGEGDAAGTLLGTSLDEAYRAWDAEGLRTLGDPPATVSAWRKVLGADNHFKGASRIPPAQMLVHPALSADERRARLQRMEQLSGAAIAGENA